LTPVRQGIAGITFGVMKRGVPESGRAWQTVAAILNQLHKNFLRFYKLSQRPMRVALFEV